MNKVIIERIETDKAIVYPFDEISETIIDSPTEVCKITDAKAHYDIIGELTDNGINLYSGEDIDEEDYSEFSVADDSDDDE